MNSQKIKKILIFVFLLFVIILKTTFQKIERIGVKCLYKPFKSKVQEKTLELDHKNNQFNL